MRNTLKIATALAAGALVLAGCGRLQPSAAPGGSPTPTGSGPAASSIKVGMAYDIGGRGDKSFNDSAAAGLDKAKAEFGVEPRSSPRSPARPTQREERLRLLADGGYNPVIAVGFVYAGALEEGRRGVPRHQLRDHRRRASTDGPNVANLIFAEEQGSYLVGAAAALKPEDRQHRLHRRRRTSR